MDVATIAAEALAASEAGPISRLGRACGTNHDNVDWSKGAVDAPEAGTGAGAKEVGAGGDLVEAGSLTSRRGNEGRRDLHAERG